MVKIVFFLNCKKLLKIVKNWDSNDQMISKLFERFEKSKKFSEVIACDASQCSYVVPRQIPFSHILLVKVALILDIARHNGTSPFISAPDISFLFLQRKKPNPHQRSIDTFQIVVKIQSVQCIQCVFNQILRPGKFS